MIFSPLYSIMDSRRWLGAEFLTMTAWQAQNISQKTCTIQEYNDVGGLETEKIITTKKQ